MLQFVVNILNHQLPLSFMSRFVPNHCVSTQSGIHERPIEVLYRFFSCHYPTLCTDHLPASSKQSQRRQLMHHVEFTGHFQVTRVSVQDVHTQILPNHWITNTMGNKEPKDATDIFNNLLACRYNMLFMNKGNDLNSISVPEVVSSR